MELKFWSSPAVAGVASILFAVLLAWIAVRLARANRGDELAAAPLAPEMEVTLRDPGEVLLLVEVPRLATDYRRLQFEITEKQSGQAAIMRYRVLTAAGAVYGVSTARVPLGRMTVNGGTYVVRVAGLTPGKDYSRYRVVFSRPYLKRMIFQIVGLVLCGVGAMLCLLRALWLAGLLQQPTR